MPNARTHDALTVATGAVMLPAALCSGLPDMGGVNAGVLVGAHLVSGFLFSPDLDVRSASYRRWRALRWLWIPYQRMVPHRSWVSHSLLLGPLLRIVYFAGVMSLLALAVLGILNLLVPVDPTGLFFRVTATISAWIERHPATIFYALLGFILGGALHSLIDSLFSGVKRSIRRRL